MSRDSELISEYLRDVEDRFGVYDLVELLGLEASDLVERFAEEIIRSAEVRASMYL